MCATCGCSDRVVPERQLIPLEEDLLAKNDAAAARNRDWLQARRILSVNLMSSPGSGKTTLLERSARELDRRISVVEGDQETELDANRIRSTGVPVVQINTGSGCHLDAEMVRRGLDALSPEPESVLFIENVGNLVCPALFDLGEQRRVVIMSVTEGADKPAKYPHMFAASDVVVLNKVDLEPYVDFDRHRFLDDLHRLQPHIDVLALSARTGEGLDAWYGWLEHELAHLTATDHHHHGGPHHPREVTR